MNQVNIDRHFNLFFSKLIIENETTDDSLHLLINQWDVGEGRLRPRQTPKVTSSELVNKAKCDVCHKFFGAAYLDVRC